MARCMPTLNPPKTLKAKLPRITNPIPSTQLFKTLPKSKKFTRISATIMSSHLKQQQLPSLDALISSDRREEVMGAIKSSLSNCLSETDLHLTVPGLKSKVRGKVRDIYDGGDYLVLVTTDRQSAFDRILASIPFKGQVLNEMSLWWFDKTQHITRNAVVSSPDRNVTIAKKCSVFPVEFVVRGYVTGSTDTSLWMVYNKGVRNYCGNVLPDGAGRNCCINVWISFSVSNALPHVLGLVKSQKLHANILTPTTKAADHDVPVTPDEIVKRGLMTKDDFDEASAKALRLFEYGQQVALEHGLILVDTKYEFGKGSDGEILLVDEVHTPDSSRYWIAHSYEERLENGLEPENVDKVLPDAPEELVSELAWRALMGTTSLWIAVESTGVHRNFPFERKYELPCVPAAMSTFSKVGEEQEKAAKEARENMKTLESGLEGKRFFGGEAIGFADIAIGWMGIWIRIIEEITDVKLIDEETMPLLSAWFQDFLEDPIIKERAPPRDKLLEHCKGFHKKLMATST
ncbi:hypothetical protein RJ639_044432 [Escallonia herrerae]|uniref:phosphoribosylaminoimidazolesuccinocarboxamide synthase n=1 Tax=Escallonia herrerae TaxID=1293975 RepID=A0AA89B716_9ASTE|nr:hypothetical protein RJ639_044432 [Escallonia herrerae]